MSKIVIGLQSRHDGGYAILDDGEVVEHVEIERYTRIKEDGGNSWEYFVERYLKPRNISVEHALENFDFVAPLPSNTISHHADHVYDIPNKLKEKVKYFGHHLCHASHAYFSSPFDDSIVISIDNAGMETPDEAISCGIYLCKEREMKKIWSIPSEQFSLGNLWGRMTRYVFKLWSGYPRGHQAGSVMAMAALGDPMKYYTEVRKMFGVNHKAATMSPPGAKRGVYVPPEEEVVHPFLNKFREIAEDEQEKFNLAASLQMVSEELLSDLVSRAFNLTEEKGYSTKNLCFSGGCSLNSVAMGKIWNKMQMAGWEMYIPPVPYDGGLNIGAAQYHYHHVLDYPKYYNKNLVASSYLGEVWNVDEINKTISENSDKISIKKNVEIKDVAQLLADGKIISVYNGRSESGRRALGNRSILANPAIPDMKKIINDRVKHRQWYRPFAPSILEEYGDEWFVNFFPSPYMSFVFYIKEEMRGKAPAIEHFDGTARLQSVNAEQNEWYYNLISEFHGITGIPLVLNTSFNDREPIVETPQDAFNCFLGTDIDYLYFAETKDLINKNELSGQKNT